MSTVNPDDSGGLAVRLAFVGGGSGGHLFPAVAVCEALLGLNVQLHALFLVSHRPADLQVLAHSNLPSDRIRIVPYASMPGENRPLSQIFLVPRAMGAYRTARRELRQFEPQVAVGVGAAASVPGILAAHRSKIPIVLMEQNTIPGKATRVLASRAVLTLAGLPFHRPADSTWPSPIEVTGTPVRRKIADLGETHSAHTGSRSRLLILGGSQGSASVNRLVLEALADEFCVPSDWEIVHQTGAAQVHQVAAEYARRGRTATVLSFLPNLPELLTSATVVISRAGAGTLQELACAGAPSILIPFSRAASDHQLVNARLLAASSAARIVDETQDDAGLRLRALLNELIRSLPLRTELRSQIRSFARPDAATRSAKYLLQVAADAETLG